MNGKLRTQAPLLGKAREKAIRLAIIFAHAEGADRITADIAKRACRVVSYSICVSVTTCFLKLNTTELKWTP